MDALASSIEGPLMQAPSCLPSGRTVCKRTWPYMATLILKAMSSDWPAAATCVKYTS
jgi:hypothetical protein